MQVFDEQPPATPCLWQKGRSVPDGYARAGRELEARVCEMSDSARFVAIVERPFGLLARSVSTVCTTSLFYQKTRDGIDKPDQRYNP